HKPGRRGRRRPLALARPVAADLLALTALSLILVGLLAAVALLAPTHVAFDLDRPPASVVLHNFYDPERNDSGPYRWTKPYASLSIPLDAPADYRLALDLQDGPAGQPPRTVTVYVAGAPADTIMLAPAVREYVFQYPMTWQTWTRRGGRTLSVELQTHPLV